MGDWPQHMVCEMRGGKSSCSRLEGPAAFHPSRVTRVLPAFEQKALAGSPKLKVTKLKPETLPSTSELFLK